MLLVEDNPAHAEQIQRVLTLEAPEYRLIHLPDAEQALEMLVEAAGAEGGADLPDLILLDIRLPRQDGHALLRELQGHPALRDIPVIMLSTSTAYADVTGALDRQAVDYLVKPFSAVHVDAIRRALESCVP